MVAQSVSATSQTKFFMATSYGCFGASRSQSVMSSVHLPTEAQPFVSLHWYHLKSGTVPCIRSTLKSSLPLGRIYLNCPTVAIVLYLSPDVMFSQFGFEGLMTATIQYNSVTRSYCKSSAHLLHNAL